MSGAEPQTGSAAFPGAVSLSWLSCCASRPVFSNELHSNGCVCENHTKAPRIHCMADWSDRRSHLMPRRWRGITDRVAFVRGVRRETGPGSGFFRFTANYSNRSRRWTGVGKKGRVTRWRRKGSSHLSEVKFTWPQTAPLWPQIC